MPRPMTNACAALAPSSIDSSGKARRYLSPLSGLLDAGPVEPLQLPSALAQITNQRLVSIGLRSEEHTSELQSLMRISYAVFCLKKKTTKQELLRRGP